MPPFQYVPEIIRDTVLSLLRSCRGGHSGIASKVNFAAYGLRALNIICVYDIVATHAIWALERCILEGHTMAKGKNSKKETKKPKKEKPKISATANSIAGKPMIGAKK